MSERDDDLLTAHLDGVGEMTADERRRLDELLRDRPELRVEAAATREMLDRLRSLPPDGQEPDWSSLERAIRVEIGDVASAHRPWWRRVAWLGPIGTLAATATIAMLWLHHPETPARAVDAGVPDQVVEPVASTTSAVWLDGHAVDVGGIDPAALEVELGRDALRAPSAGLGLLPVDDLEWVDGLDDGAIDRAEQWLASKQKKS